MAPPKRTPGAVVQGPQTAMVVGDGEIDSRRIWPHSGEVPLDLVNAYSMRCRARTGRRLGWHGHSTHWHGGAGRAEGDPDKPVVVGNVFNGMNDAPYPLPDEQDQDGDALAVTHQGSGFNELSFEDQAGREEIYMHGQKDHR